MPLASGPWRHVCRHRRGDVEAQVEIERRAARAHVDRPRLTALVVLFGDADVGGVAERTVRTEHADEARESSPDRPPRAAETRGRR